MSGKQRRYRRRHLISGATITPAVGATALAALIVEPDRRAEPFQIRRSRSQHLRDRYHS
ncbi:hypothetical protein I546_0086 [Mycobacterium kansasii 732]|nr:hypothetical protein I546_0086 [Mycobacterium kansasii 732]